MVKLDAFDILFENAEHAFFAGQEISGRILIRNSDAKKVNEILLEIKGCAKTYWTKHSGKSRRHCSASESYFCEQFNTRYTHKLEGTDEEIANGSTAEKKISLTKKERILPAGTHEIPFSYTLPKSLPSSFEGDYGYVRYTCRAICERPWDFDISTRRAFTVVGIEDLNEDSEAVKPVSNSAIIHQKLWCLKRGDVISQLQLVRGGYTPGETIYANVHIQNNSRRILRNVCLALCQDILYKAKTFSGIKQTRQTLKTIAKVERPGEIRQNCESSWNDAQIIVPSVVPRLTNCKIIQITYSLQVKIQSDVVVSVPLFIGTIPLLSEIVKRSTNSAQSNVVQPAENHSHQTATATSLSVAPDDSSFVQVTITDESGRTAAMMEDVMASSPQVPVTSAIDDGSEITKTTAISLHDKREVAEMNNAEPATTVVAAKKRVRMPSSILSELYPTLPSPYYKESLFGRVSISEEKEKNQFGENLFAPKYPFYGDD